MLFKEVNVKTLSLDISTKTGWALASGKMGERPILLEYGVIKTDKPVFDYGEYPWNFYSVSQTLACQMYDLVKKHKPDVIVIESPNLGRSRMAQRQLEWIHCCLMTFLVDEITAQVVYVSSSSWRQALGLVLSKEDKKNNAKLSKAKKQVAAGGGSIHEAKKRVGVKGKVNAKHLALRYVNEHYKLDLKVKDNDKADAIGLSCAYYLEAKKDDGLM